MLWMWFWLQNLANVCVKKVFATRRFSIHRLCKTFCFVSFYQPALCRNCVFVRDVVETVTFNIETETWLKFRDRDGDRDFIKNSETETEISKFVHFAEIKQNVVMTSELNFFKFLELFELVLVISYLQIQQTKNRWIIKILLNHFFPIFKVSTPEAFDTRTETRSETFETETQKNGSRDKFPEPDRDQVLRFHHWYLYYELRVCWKNAFIQSKQRMALCHIQLAKYHDGHGHLVKNR